MPNIADYELEILSAFEAGKLKSVTTKGELESLGSGLAIKQRSWGQKSWGQALHSEASVGSGLAIKQLRHQWGQVLQSSN